jgi:hypothetical protein
MSRQLNEPEWKVLRELRPIALDRFCRRALSEVGLIASDTTRGAHERYLAVFKLPERRDDELANAFNDVRRSTALQCLLCIKSLDLLTEEEMARFSPETRNAVGFLAKALLG